MSGNFAPGQFVECIESEWKSPKPKIRYPVKGSIYVVRDVELRGHIPGIRLEEIVNDVFQFDDLRTEPAFDASAFRPVDPRRLEIFRKALTSRPVTEVV